MYLIISKDNCQYCFKARALLEQAGLEYIEYKIGKTITREEALEIAPGAKSVPVIFNGKERIGGYDDLIEYLGADHVN